MDILTPKMKKPTALPGTPDRSDSETQALALEQRKALIGQQSPAWLTGGMGVPNSSVNFAASTLLGGGSS
jgi:hypothetical protein